MPINPLPIVIPLLLVWGTIAYFLIRWRRWAGSLFVGVSVVLLVLAILNTGVARQLDEPMTFRLIEIGNYKSVELTTSRGDRITAGSSELVARLHGRTNQTVRVLMTGTYDFGRLRGYRVQSIDGVSQ